MQIHPDEAVIILGIDPRPYLSRVRTFEEAQQNLERFKENLIKIYKQKCKELHPDLNPDIDSELIKRLNLAKDLFMKLKLIKPQHVPVRTTIIIHKEPTFYRNPDYNHFTATASGTSGTGYYGY